MTSTDIERYEELISKITRFHLENDSETKMWLSKDESDLMDRVELAEKEYLKKNSDIQLIFKFLIEEEEERRRKNFKN